MAKKNYAAAMIEAFDLCIKDDPTFAIIGNEIFGLGPERFQFEPFQEAHRKNIFFPPIAEAAFVALSAGAAMCGQKVFAHIGMGSFTYPAMSSIANEIATAHYSSGGRVNVPVILHVNHGIAPGAASQHCESPQSMYWNLPGIQIVVPSCGSDFKGLVRTAFKSPNPTMIFTHAMVYGSEDDVPEGDYSIPFGKAKIRRKGKDVTVFATSRIVGMALDAAKTVAKEGIDVEVIDPRTLRPLDKKALLASVAKTGRLVVADETREHCGVASEIAAIVAEEGFSSLKGPIIRMSRPNVPLSAAPTQEAVVAPTPDKIADAIRKAMK